MKHVIRPAKKSDASVMYRISVAAHTQSYYNKLIPDSQKQAFANQYIPSSQKRQRFISGINQKMNDPQWFLRVAEINGDVVGYTLVCKEDDRLLLKGLFVDPVHQREGVGTDLFKTSLLFAEKNMPIELVVIRDNFVAKTIYEKHNFRVTGPAKRKFFGAVQDIMQKG